MGESKKYAILCKYEGRKKDKTGFYIPLMISSLEIDAIIRCINACRCSCKTYQDIEKTLCRSEGFLNFITLDGNIESIIAYDDEYDLVYCNIIDHTSCKTTGLEEFTIKESKDLSTQFSVSAFLDLTQKIIDAFDQNIEFIVVYLDKNEEFHVEPYQLTDEQREKWKHYIK